MPFSLTEPDYQETAVVVEVPHAGLAMDPESMAYCIAPCRSIGQDADLFVSDLFLDAPSLGAHLLVSNLSRYVCDLNRSPDEYDSLTCSEGQTSTAPHGVIWRNTTSGRPAIAAPLPHSEVERRLAKLYHPYHQTLEGLLQRKVEKFGFAILLCAHSMPSFGRLGERRADVVPGSRDGSTTSRRLLESCDQIAAKAGYDVAHDAPYRGGFTTQHYGRPNAGVHALQIELARRIYMDEASLRQIEGPFSHCSDFCTKLVQAFGNLKP